MRLKSAIMIGSLGIAGCNSMQISPSAVDFGDSTSKAYAAYTRLDLYGQVDLRHDPYDQGDIVPSDSSSYISAEIAYGNNNGYSSTLLLGMEQRLVDKVWFNVLAFNSGYHDIQHLPGKPIGTAMISQSEYRDNLEAIAQLAEQHAGIVIWVDTPGLEAAEVPVGADVADAVNVPIYNGIAREVAQEHGFYMLSMPGTDHDGTVHFTTEGYRILGQHLADCVLTALDGAETADCHR